MPSAATATLVNGLPEAATSAGLRSRSPLRNRIAQGPSPSSLRNKVARYGDVITEDLFRRDRKMLTRDDIKAAAPDLIDLIGFDGRSTEERTAMAARRLGVSYRRCKAWRYGETPPTAWEWHNLLTLAETTKARMARVREQINELDREIAELRGQADRADMQPLGRSRGGSDAGQG